METRCIRDTDYTIDVEGNVYSPRGLTVTPWTEVNTGYLLFRIRKNNKPLSLRLHRVLGECWIPNPNNLPFVKHKNDVKSDNRLDNLEWGSHSDNVQEGYNNGQYQYTQRCHKIIATCKSSGEEFSFKSLRSTSESLHIDRKGISAVLKGKKANYYEYEFRYKMPND